MMKRFLSLLLCLMMLAPVLPAAAEEPFEAIEAEEETLIAIEAEEEPAVEITREAAEEAMEEAAEPAFTLCELREGAVLFYDAALTDAVDETAAAAPVVAGEKQGNAVSVLYAHGGQASSAWVHAADLTPADPAEAAAGIDVKGFRLADALLRSDLETEEAVEVIEEIPAEEIPTEAEEAVSIEEAEEEPEIEAEAVEVTEEAVEAVESVEEIEAIEAIEEIEAIEAVEVVEAVEPVEVSETEEEPAELAEESEEAARIPAETEELPEFIEECLDDASFGLSYSQGYIRITLKRTADEAEFGEFYGIMRSEDGTNFAKLSDVRVTPGTLQYIMVDYDVKPTMTYYYKFAFYIDDKNIKAYTLPKGVTVGPDYTTNLKAATVMNGRQIRLTWNEYPGAKTYSIYRSTVTPPSDGTVTDMTAVGSTGSQSWTDSTVLSGTTYYYRVLALDESGANLSTKCIFASAATAANATLPAELSAAGGQTSFSWSLVPFDKYPEVDMTDGTKQFSYLVERANSVNGSFSSVGTVWVNADNIPSVVSLSNFTVTIADGVCTVTSSQSADRGKYYRVTLQSYGTRTSPTSLPRVIRSGAVFLGSRSLPGSVRAEGGEGQLIWTPVAFEYYNQVDLSEDGYVVNYNIYTSEEGSGTFTYYASVAYGNDGSLTLSPRKDTLSIALSGGRLVLTTTDAEDFEKYYRVWVMNYEKNGHKEDFPSRSASTLYMQAVTSTVTFNANGGEGGPVSQVKSLGVDLVLSDETPVREGYVFGGWSTDRNSLQAEYQPGGTFTSEEDTTLFAVWLAQYTISFDANGGEGAPAGVTKTQTVSLRLPAQKPTREGYLFRGWSADSAASVGSWSAGAAYNEDGDATLYAVWTEYAQLKPGTISAISAQPEYTNAARISWTVDGDSDGCQLFRSDSRDGDYTWVKNNSDGSVVNYTLAPGSTWWYKVRTYIVNQEDKQLFGEFSQPVQVKIPGAIENFTVTGKDTNCAFLKWDRVDNVTGYQVFRTVAGSGVYTWVKNATTPQVANYALKAGTTYYYKVRAYVDCPDGSRAYGPYSEGVRVDILKQAEITGATWANGAKLTWQTVPGTITGYQVFYVEGGTNGVYTWIANTTDKTITLKGRITAGKNWYFRVRAYLDLPDGTRYYGQFSEAAHVMAPPAAPALSVPMEPEAAEETVAFAAEEQTAVEPLDEELPEAIEEYLEDSVSYTYNAALGCVSVTMKATEAEDFGRLVRVTRAEGEDGEFSSFSYALTEEENSYTVVDYDVIPTHSYRYKFAFYRTSTTVKTYTTRAITVGRTYTVNLKAAPVSGSANVSLTWNEYPGAARYVIYRGNGEDNEDDSVTGMTRVGTSAETSYTDTSALGNTAYFYRVLAEGLSTKCRPAAVTTGSAVLPVSVQVQGGATAISWNAVPFDSYQQLDLTDPSLAVYYYVYTSDTEDGTYKLTFRVADGIGLDNSPRFPAAAGATLSKSGGTITLTPTAASAKNRYYQVKLAYSIQLKNSAWYLTPWPGGQTSAPVYCGSVPSLPSQVTAHGGNGCISWEAVPFLRYEEADLSASGAAVTYLVMRGSSRDGSFSSLCEVTVSADGSCTLRAAGGSVTVTADFSGGRVTLYGAPADMGRFYRVAPKSYTGGTWPSPVAGEAVYMTRSPARVTGVNAKPDYTNSARITWQKQEGAAGYQLLRADSEDGEYVWIKNNPTTTVVNYVLTPGADYWYKVRAYTLDESGNKILGPLSAAAHVHNLGAIANLKTSSPAKGQAVISFDAVEGATGYQLFRTVAGTGGNFTWVKNSAEPPVTNYGLETGTIYYFKVRAYVDLPDGTRAYGQFSEGVPVKVK